MSDPLLVDARGLRCPWPAIRLGRTARTAAPGATIRVLADDPAAPRELAALASERNWAFTPLAEPGSFEIRT